jgi:hypothetical protein
MVLGNPEQTCAWMVSRGPDGDNGKTAAEGPFDRQRGLRAARPRPRRRTHEDYAKFSYQGQSGTMPRCWQRQASEWINRMKDNTKDLDQIDEDILTFDVSDEALEAAANIIMDAAMSLGTPTVNILVICCGDNNIAAPDRG